MLAARWPSTKPKRRWRWAVLAAILVAPTLVTTSGSWAGAGPILYGATGQQAVSDLLVLDPATGALADTVGPMGHGFSGLAFNPVDGQLYGATTFDGTATARLLVRVDPATGAVTVIGPFGVDAIADLAFAPDGTLYGWVEPGSDDLATIDLATGAATIVGDSGLDTFGGGLEYDAASDRLLLAGNGSNGELHALDPATGAATVVSTLDDPGGDAVSALAFGCDGTLFGVLLEQDTSDRLSRLATIAPDSGAVTAVGPSVNGLDAIEWSCAVAPPPEPPAPEPPAPGAAVPVLVVQARFTG
ncbi:MAG: DUF6923 family protein [Acidimicrobiia bacterium]